MSTASIAAGLRPAISVADVGDFIRLLDVEVDEKQATLAEVVDRFRTAGRDERVFQASGCLFKRYPSSAFVYDLPVTMADFFLEGAPVPELFFQAQRGLGASNSEHLFRAAWEVDPSDIGLGRRWTRFNNGGPYSPFYYPSVFVVRSDRSTWKSLLAYNTGAITGSELYGRPSIGFGKRTNFMYGYPLPAEHAFSVEGQTIFPSDGNGLPTVLAIVNSRLYAALANRFTAQHKYHGYLNALWLRPFDTAGLGQMATDIAERLRRLDETNETSPQFRAPLIEAPTKPAGIFRVTADWAESINRDANERRSLLDTELERRLEVTVEPIDQPPYDVNYIDAFFGGGAESGPALWAANLVQWCVGCVFGRFDARSARDPQALPRADLFTALPAIAVGALSENCDVGHLVVRDGILVDDEGHPRDIVAAIREVLAFAFGDRCAADLETEVLTTLRGDGRTPTTLREWLRGQKASPLGKTFFDFHVQRYSRSRRKAPIHWRLTTASDAPYSVWLHYPHLTRDTLWTVLSEYLGPRDKLAGEQLLEVRARRDAANGAHRRQLEEEMTRRSAIAETIQALDTEIRHVLGRGYSPSIDDGVLVTIAPLHRIVPWAEAAKVWHELENGDHDWAALSKTLWPERVARKCQTDNSLAVAHSLF